MYDYFGTTTMLLPNSLQKRLLLKAIWSNFALKLEISEENLFCLKIISKLPQDSKKKYFLPQNTF